MKTNKITWSLIKKNINELKEWELNPRHLTEKGISDLKKSIDKFGCCEPIVINTDNTICGGHGRKKVLESFNVQEVDCYIPNRLLEPEEFAELNIRLNKNIAGEFDMNVLANFGLDLLRDIGFTDEDLGIAEVSDKKCFEKFEILVECDNEEHQKELYSQFMCQKLKCKILSV